MCSSATSAPVERIFSCRRLRGGMIEVFKTTHNIYDTTVSPDLSFNDRANIKLHNHSLRYDLRKLFFLLVLLIPGTACLIQLLMLARLMMVR